MKIKRKKKRVAPKAAPAQAQEQTSRQYKSVENVIKPDMIAYHYWREWFRARDRNDWPFMYEMSGEGSPLRERLGDLEGFPERCRRRDRSVPGLRPGNLQKIRLDGPDVAQVLRVVGMDDRARKEITVERYCMLREQDGWQMYAVDDVTRPRSEVEEGVDVGWFETFVVPEGFVGRSEIEQSAQEIP